jgi:hypothetical protein
MGCGFVSFQFRAQAEIAMVQMNGFALGKYVLFNAADSNLRISWGNSPYVSYPYPMMYPTLPMYGMPMYGHPMMMSDGMVSDQTAAAAAEYDMNTYSNHHTAQAVEQSQQTSDGEENDVNDEYANTVDNLNTDKGKYQTV